jgi:hypothetical protein
MLYEKSESQNAHTLLNSTVLKQKYNIYTVGYRVSEI